MTSVEEKHLPEEALKELKRRGAGEVLSVHFAWFFRERVSNPPLPSVAREGALVLVTKRGVLVWAQRGFVFIDRDRVVELEVFEGSPLRLSAGAPRVSIVYRGDDGALHACTLVQFATAYRRLPFDAREIGEALGATR